jgi:hypothetical protein
MLGALLCVSGVLASGSTPAYLHVSSFTAGLAATNLAQLSVDTGGSIPRQPDSFISNNPVVGFAWADLDSGKVFVVVIHPVIGRDSHQNPDSWHAHTATLAGGSSSANNFCVASIDSTPTAGIQIRGSHMVVNVRADALPVVPSAFDAAVGFTIQADSACPSGLAVRIAG